MHIRSRQFRFGAVAHAIGSNQKSLRHWLERGLVRITEPVEKKGSWQDFNLIDVFVLVLVRRLVDHGVPVKVADDIAQGEISTAVIGPWEMPAEQFLAGFIRKWLVVRNVRAGEGEEGGWQAMPYREGDKLHLFGDDAFTIIDLGTLFHGAYERAAYGYDLPTDMYLKPRTIVLTAEGDAGAIKVEG